MVNHKMIAACLKSIATDDVSETDALIRLRYILKKYPEASGLQDEEIPTIIADARYNILLEKYNELEQKYNTLVGGATPKPVVQESDFLPNGHMKYHAFRRIAAEKFKTILPQGSDKGLHQAFIDATNDKYNFGNWAKWRKDDSVPPSVVADLNALVIQPKEAKSPQRWTDAEKGIFLEYVQTDEDNYMTMKGKIDDVAKLLSQRLGRHITPGMVKSKLNALRETGTNVTKADFKAKSATA